MSGGHKSPLSQREERTKRQVVGGGCCRALAGAMAGWAVGESPLQCRAHHRVTSVNLHFPALLKRLGKTDGTVMHVD